ncbi:hypothetical protein [Methylomagnum sp.]
MFEKIVLRRSENGAGLTAGELAEALLFYQNVHLVLDYGSLSGLVSQIGMPTLVSLLTRPNVSAVYCKNLLAVHTEKQLNTEIHRFVAFSIAGDQEVGTLHGKKKILEYILTKKHGYDKKQARRLVDRFWLKVPIKDLTKDHFIQGGIIQAARMDLHDTNFIHNSVKVSLHDLVGPENTPQSFIFKAHTNGSDFQIETNIDFSRINQVIARRQPFPGNITPAHLIGNVLNARADTILASYYGGEFYTSNITSKIIRTKYSELIRRAGIDRKELDEFHQIVIGDAPTLREVINRKERTFDEFLVILDKSQRFREWARGVNPDEKLVSAYWNEIASEGWIKKLPTKGLRYLAGAIIGTMDPITGHTVSIADSFLLEKIFGGWRPNHFIDDMYKPFLGDED